MFKLGDLIQFLKEAGKDYSITGIAKKAGVNVEWLYQIRYGRNDILHWATADKLACKNGFNPLSIWGDTWWQEGIKAMEEAEAAKIKRKNQKLEWAKQNRAKIKEELKSQRESYA